MNDDCILEVNFLKIVNLENVFDFVFETSNQGKIAF